MHAGLHRVFFVVLSENICCESITINTVVTGWSLYLQLVNCTMITVQVSLAQAPSQWEQQRVHTTSHQFHVEYAWRSTIEWHALIGSAAHWPVQDASAIRYMPSPPLKLTRRQARPSRRPVGSWFAASCPETPHCRSPPPSTPAGCEGHRQLQLHA